VTGGAPHDPIESRRRLRSSVLTAEYDRWRDLPPKLRPVAPPPLPIDLLLLLSRLRLRYARLEGPAVLARAGDEGWCWRHACMGMNRPVMAALNGDVDSGWRAAG
jgi:hypothetical protein